jgi:hypothetical protein
MEVYLETMTQPNNYVLEGGASNQVLASLVRIFSQNQTSISYVNSYNKLNFNQSANVKNLVRMRVLNISNDILK